MVLKPRLSRLADILAVMLLVVALLMTGLWIRSYWRSYYLMYRSTNHADRLNLVSINVHSFPGHISFERRFSRFHSKARLDAIYKGFDLISRPRNRKITTSMRRHLQQAISGFTGRPSSFWNKLGFFDSSSRFDSDHINFIIPHWSAVAATAIFSVLWLPFRIRRYIRSKKLGLCLRCGYDLRESSKSCPECGQAIEHA